MVSSGKLEAQTAPMMLMMLALGGAAGRLARAVNPNTTLKIQVVGSACGCKYQCLPVLVGSALYDKHDTGLACIAQAKPNKMCTLHGFGVLFC